MPVASPWDIPLRNHTYYALGVEFMVGTLILMLVIYHMPGGEHQK
jgi:hypothetical protein